MVEALQVGKLTFGPHPLRILDSGARSPEKVSGIPTHALFKPKKSTLTILTTPRKPVQVASSFAYLEASSILATTVKMNIFWSYYYGHLKIASQLSMGAQCQRIFVSFSEYLEQLGSCHVTIKQKEPGFIFSRETSQSLVRKGCPSAAMNEVTHFTRIRFLVSIGIWTETSVHISFPYASIHCICRSSFLILATSKTNGVWVTMHLEGPDTSFLKIV